MGTANSGAILSYINPTTLTAISIPSLLQSDVLSTLLHSCLATKMVNACLYYLIHTKCPFTLCQTSPSQQRQSHTRIKNVCMYVCIQTHTYTSTITMVVQDMNFSVKSRCRWKFRYSCHSVQVLLSNCLFRETETSHCTYKCFNHSY